MGFTSLRNQVLGRYPAFFHQLLKSPSKEVRLLANIAARDPKTTTGKNLLYLERLSGLDPWNFSSKRIKEELPVKKVPGAEEWRLGLLTSLIRIKKEKFMNCEEYSRICAMLDSLCST